MKTVQMQLQDLIQFKGHKFSLDVETTGLDYLTDGLIGIGVHCPELGIQTYIPTCTYEERPFGKPKEKMYWEGEYYINPATGRKNQLKVKRIEQPTRLEAIPIPEMRAQASQIMHELGNDPNTVMVLHNAKFDFHFLDFDPWGLPFQLVDTQTMVHLYDSRMRKALAIAERVILGTNSKRAHKTQIIEKYRKNPHLWTLDQVTDYCINDCAVTYQLAEELGPKLRNLKLGKMFKSEMYYIRALWGIERAGVRINRPFTERAVIELGDNLKRMEVELYDTTGQADFNWNSHQQLSRAIYQGLGIPKPVNPVLIDEDDPWERKKIDKKKDGSYTWATGTPILRFYSHPLAPLISDMRETSKLIANAVSYLQLSQVDGKVHPKFRETGTVTGRISCGDPNLQNVAKEERKRDYISEYTGGAKREGSYNMREAFMADPGYTLFSTDHAQQEIRLLAVITGEPFLLEALRARKDIHLMIALKWWGDCGPELNKLHRDWSKALSFGLLYGLGLPALAAKMGKSTNEADEIMQSYFDTFPGIKPYLDRVTRQVETNGRVRYWSGRLWRPYTPDKAYVGVNATIQGGAADLLKLAVIRMMEVLRYQKWGTVISIIHDEVISMIRNEYVQVAQPVILKIMEMEDIFQQPFKADLAIGQSYGTLQSVDDVDLTGINWLDYARPDLRLEDVSLIPWAAGRV